MAVELAEAYVSLIPTTKGMQGALARELAPIGRESSKQGDEAGRQFSGRFTARFRTGLGSVSSSFKQSAGSLAATAGALFAADKVKDFFVESTKGWQDHLKVLALTKQVIKTTGGAAGVSAKQVGDLSDQIEAQTGVDGDLVLNGENMLLTFTNIRNEVGKGNDIFNQATQTVTDMSVALGQDTKGSAIQLGKALNDPVKGVTALSKVGVSFTAQQKDQIATLVKSGNTLGAQKIILKELNREFGGAAKAAVTPAEKLTVAYHSLQDQVGGILLPVVAKVTTFLANRFLPIVQTGIAWVTANAPRLGPVFQVAGQIITAALGYIATGASWLWTNVLVPLVAWVRANWPGISAAFITAWQNIEPTVIAFRGLLLSLWTSVLQPLAAWIVAHWPQISAVVRVVFIAIAVAAKIMLVALQVVFTALAVAIRVAAAVFSWLWRSIVVPVFNGIVAAVRSASGGIRTAVGIIGGIVSGVGGFFKNAYDTASRYIDDIVTAVTGLPGKVAGLAGDMVDAGGKLMGGLYDGIRNAAGAVGDIGRAIVNSLINFLNGVLPHHIGIHKGPINVDVPLFPNIPNLAAGATILPRSGGTLVNVAEAGRAESVVDTGGLNALVRNSNALAGAALGTGTAGGPTIDARGWQITEVGDAVGTATATARRLAMLGNV